MEQLSAIEFQYNNKKHVTTGYTPFKLNFGRYPWKENLIVKTESPKLENFSKRLQRIWKAAKKSKEIAKEDIKKQFNKKKR